MKHSRPILCTLLPLLIVVASGCARLTMADYYERAEERFERIARTSYVLLESAQIIRTEGRKSAYLLSEDDTEGETVARLPAGSVIELVAQDYECTDMLLNALKERGLGTRNCRRIDYYILNGYPDYSGLLFARSPALEIEHVDKPSQWTEARKAQVMAHESYRRSHVHFVADTGPLSRPGLPDNIEVDVTGVRYVDAHGRFTFALPSMHEARALSEDVRENVTVIRYPVYPQQAQEFIAIENPGNVGIMVSDYISRFRRMNDFVRAWNIDGRFGREYRILRVMRHDDESMPGTTIHVITLFTARELMLMASFSRRIIAIRPERLDVEIDRTTDRLDDFLAGLELHREAEPSIPVPDIE